MYGWKDTDILMRRREDLGIASSSFTACSALWSDRFELSSISLEFRLEFGSG